MKLKRAVLLALSALLAIGLAACGSREGAKTAPIKKQGSGEDVLQAGIKEAEGSTVSEPSRPPTPVLQIPEDSTQGSQDAPSDASSDANSDFIATGSIDHVKDPSGVFDLTKFTGNTLFAEVFNMVAAPAEYVGETIRMTGTMLITKDMESGRTFYSCFMRDAMGCCSQGFEFELAKGSYPEADTPITIVGEFDIYEENESTYCIIRNAVIE